MYMRFIYFFSFKQNIFYVLFNANFLNIHKIKYLAISPDILFSPAKFKTHFSLTELSVTANAVLMQIRLRRTSQN